MTSHDMHNDAAYYQRRNKLLVELRRWPQGALCRELAATLGWRSAEVSAKLMSLRVGGLARYDGSGWIATGEEDR